MSGDFLQIVLLQLFAIVVIAKISGYLARKGRMPSVIGEILAGIIIGNTILFDVLQLDTNAEVLEVFKELGVIFLLFTVGLETPFSELRKIGKTAMGVAVLGVIVPFFAGLSFMLLLGSSHVESMFVGAALVATSIGITARVINDLGLANAIESRVIIGAAVIDDILGMIVLAVVVGVSLGGSAGIANALIVSLEGVFFVLLVIIVGGMLIPRARRMRESAASTCPPESRSRGFGAIGMALMVCFGLSFVASYLGLAAIIGAFLAGMIFSEFRDLWPCKEKFEPLNEFLVPFFFIFVGVSVDVSSFGSVIWIAIAITLLAVATKYVGCGAGAWRMGKRSASIVGLGMIPRGEVGIIIATIGLGMGVVSEGIFAGVIFMSLATTIVAPPLLNWAFKKKQGDSAALEEHAAG